MDAYLPKGLSDLFTSQQVADQRHALQAGERVVADGVDDPDLIAAALLHDVGKRHSRLGAIGRSIATLLMSLRLPMSSRMNAYRDHGRLGAIDLEAASAPAVVVEFARHHQLRRPPNMSRETWELLRRADLGARSKPRGTSDGG